MTDLRKAAEMALDALHNIDQSNNYDAIEALRQALAQPPCQTGSQCLGGKCPECVPTYEFECPRCGHCCQQKEWVGLTEDEVSEIIDKEIGFNSCWGPEYSFARAIEAKLKEKNT